MFVRGYEEYAARMCGIVGYSGSKSAAPILVAGLKRLEYRGYDSAGICVSEGTGLRTIRKPGKIRALQDALPPSLPGAFGIGHTRWATHGEVNERNAHPHLDMSGKIAIVHNGIIENYMVLKERLKGQGVVFASDTDSEVIAHLIASLYKGNLEAAVKQALGLIKGTYGLLVVHSAHPGEIVGARNGSPLVIGVGEHEMFLASDVMAIMAYTRQVVYVEDGEIVHIDASGFTTTDIKDNAIDKEVQTINWELDAIEKEGFGTYMEKEIFEQPSSILRAMQGRLDFANGTAKLGGLNMSAREMREVEQIVIVAAGTSYHAGMVAAYVIEQLARIPARAELASEIRYRNPIVDSKTLYFIVSQSGETADTLYAMREIKRKGGRCLGICNVVGSTIPRESDGGTYIHSGPEISVASTKAFTSQLTAFYLVALLFARMRDLSLQTGQQFVEALQTLPTLVENSLKTRDQVMAIAKKFSSARDFLFMGRGICYPLALEGALKLKEISYIHAEGYAAGEIKHGPIALVQPETPSVFLVPNDSLREKVLSNMKEIHARRGTIVAIATEGDHEVAQITDHVIYVPRTHEYLSPVVMMIPLQLLAYFIALELGRDIDQPRNLAKSVTVE